MPTDRHPRLFSAVLVLLSAAGVVLLLAAIQVTPVSLVIGFVAGSLVLEAAPARLRDDVLASLSSVATFAAIIVGGWSLAVLTTVGTTMAIAWRTADRRGARVAFNFGQFSISAAVAGLVFEAVRDGASAVEGLIEIRGLTALVAAAAAYTLANHLFVALAVRLTRGDGIRQTLHGVLGTSLLLQVFYLGFAVVAAVLIVEVNPFTLVLLVVPAIVARRGLLGFQAQAEAYDHLVNAFVKVIEVKDPYTRGHADRVASLSEAVAGEMGHDYETRRLVRYAAMLHDVGKVGIPVDVINKPGALNEEEREIINRHPLVGAEMLRDITFLQPVIDIVRFHHERVDGRGYPYAVPGDDLSILVRIVTAVDAFDAMTSTRSYRRALDIPEAVRELRRHAGTQFDADVVEALARTVVNLGWEPTLAFASERELASRAARLGGPASPVVEGSGIAAAGAQA